jgi:hypothetical protein
VIAWQPSLPAAIHGAPSQAAMWPAPLIVAERLRVPLGWTRSMVAGLPGTCPNMSPSKPGPETRTNPSQVVGKGVTLPEGEVTPPPGSRLVPQGPPGPKRLSPPDPGGRGEERLGARGVDAHTGLRRLP